MLSSATANVGVFPTTRRFAEKDLGTTGLCTKSLGCIRGRHPALKAFLVEAIRKLICTKSHPALS
jgi:hypothetical protein